MFFFVFVFLIRYFKVKERRDLVLSSPILLYFKIDSHCQNLQCSKHLLWIKSHIYFKKLYWSFAKEQSKNHLQKIVKYVIIRNGQEIGKTNTKVESRISTYNSFPCNAGLVLIFATFSFASTMRFSSRFHWKRPSLNRT